MAERPPLTFRARLDKAATAVAAALLAFLIVLLKSRNVVSFWYQPYFQVYSLLAAAYVLSRVLLAARYKPPPDAGMCPTLSVIVAVKNEQDYIGGTVDRVLASDYPPDRFEVSVIDDGSDDDTWGVLQRLEKKYEGRLKIFRFEKNRGKRHAMALGAERSKADILVYIDSDSFLEPDGLRKIVQPFADPKVGAVAGHTDVIHDPTSFINKMEAVRYYVAQRVIKASESVYWCVTCCPGPFSAYRREAVMRILDPWRHQTFLGAEATFGDDRSLTNYILTDYRVVYHADARARTFTPPNWRVFFKQQLRWKKSYVRETTILARKMWRKHPIAAFSYYMSVLITMASPIIALRALASLPTAAGSMAFFPYIIGLMLMYLLFGLLYHYYTRGKRWWYGVAFAVLYIFVLAFQNYYAVLTVRRNHWGTR